MEPWEKEVKQAVNTWIALKRRDVSGLSDRLGSVREWQRCPILPSVGGEDVAGCLL